jgi:hypothetical protein
MQISIQSLEVTYNKVPYRFIVKKMFNTGRNEISFHCWAPEDNEQAKNLIRNEVLMFEWDHRSMQLRHYSDHPVNHILKDAIAENFLTERT